MGWGASNGSTQHTRSRLYHALTQLNDLEVDQLSDADRERIETATALLEEVSLLTRPKSE
nr:hypothetical protein [Natronorubrum sulfidifaciens]